MPEREMESALWKYGMFFGVYLIMGLGIHVVATYFLSTIYKNPGVVWAKQKTNLMLCIYIISLSVIMFGIYLWYYSMLDLGMATNILFLTCCFAFGVACWSLLATMISKT
jgi:hypothetical protein